MRLDILEIAFSAFNSQVSNAYSHGGLLGDAMEMDRRTIRPTELFLSMDSNSGCGGTKSPLLLLLATYSVDAE